MSKKIVWSDCASCSRSTQHDVVCEEVRESEDHDIGYHFQTSWQTVECRGCNNISFRKHFIDYQSYFEDV
jgi:hypothetical protein